MRKALSEVCGPFAYRCQLRAVVPYSKASTELESTESITIWILVPVSGTLGGGALNLGRGAGPRAAHSPQARRHVSDELLKQHGLHSLNIGCEAQPRATSLETIYIPWSVSMLSTGHLEAT